jgi:hypothetical protein
MKPTVVKEITDLVKEKLKLPPHQLSIWFHTPHPDLFNQKPWDLILSGEADHVRQYLLARNQK